MAQRIDQDASRFKQIVRGKVKAHLRRFMQRGELIGRQGKDLVSIPIPQIDLPHFVLDPNQRNGVGQGEGEIGDMVGKGDGEQGEGTGTAGNAPGEHLLEVDLTLEELADILGEELELPNIRDKGQKNVQSTSTKYSGISNVGPDGMRHFKRTYREALKRQIAAGEYNPRRPNIVPIRRDLRYRTWKEQPLPSASAVIVYMMDVSGSMGDEQKEIVRIESFWIDTWLRRQYEGLDVRYIVHDAEARLVDQDTFYHTRESGGTVISSAYKLCSALLERHYPPTDWNVYLFHFSDGDNWSQGDTEECVQLLGQSLLPGANLFCYGQVESPYGTGQFLVDLKETLGKDEKVVLSQIENKDAIYRSIKEFLGQGR